MFTFVTQWVLSLWENILCRRLVKHRDNRSLRSLAALLVGHNRRFPMHKSEVREALFDVTSWVMEEKYQKRLLLDTQAYLFRNIDTTQPHEWNVWLRACQALGDYINVKRTGTALALWYAYNVNKFADLANADYLYQSYQAAYWPILTQIKLENEPRTLPILMKVAASSAILPDLNTPERNHLTRPGRNADNFLLNGIFAYLCKLKFLPFVQLFNCSEPQDPNEWIWMIYRKLLSAGLIDQQGNRSSLDPQGLGKWILDAYEELLSNCLIDQKTNQSLIDLIIFLVDHDRSFQIHAIAVRDALFQVSSWKMPDVQYQAYLFTWVEAYLFDNQQVISQHEWQVWLNAARTLDHRVDVMNPTVATRLWTSYNTPLSQEDYRHLFGPSLQAWQAILDKVTPENEQKLAPKFLAYATLVQQIGLDKDSSRILRHWSSHKKLRPRASLALSDEQVYDAPVLGVGSPHGVIVTIYYDRATQQPVRVSCAGSTGDLTLNARLFTGLFTQALACNAAPRCVMTSGATLSLQWQAQHSSSYADEGFPAISPDGPKPPIRGLPSLGMDETQALKSLMDGLFEDLQELTGLVHMTRWYVDDVEELEMRVTQALEQTDGRIRVINGDPKRPKEAGVLHVMPLLQRNSAGKVVPIEIEIPYAYLGADKVFRLLHDARQGYMQQMIAAGRRRLAIIQKAYLEQNEQVKRWQGYCEMQKSQECAPEYVNSFETVSAKF